MCPLYHTTLVSDHHCTFFDGMELKLKSGPVYVMELVMELKKVMYLVKIPG